MISRSVLIIRRSAVMLVGVWLVAWPIAARGQPAGTLRGTVVDSSTGSAIADAMILVRGTRQGAQADAHGRFSIAGLAPGDAAIVVQRLGYASRTIDVMIVRDQETVVRIALTAAAQVIAPMVVSATREMQRRKDVSATIDVLDGAALREARAAHPAAIVNRIPGVHVAELSGEGHSTAIRQPISTKPLYLYLEDGVPTRSTGFFNHNALYEVNLPQAGGMEVLKGPGTALYGSDAIGGVINVLTRAAPPSPTVDLSAEAGAYGYRRLLATGGFAKGRQGLRLDLNLTAAEGYKDNAPYERTSATVRHDVAGAEGWSLRTVVTGTTVNQRDVLALNRVNFIDRPRLNRSPIAFRDVSALRWSTAIERERGASQISITPFARHNGLELIPNWQLTFNPEIWDTQNQSYGLLLRVRRDFTPMRMRVIAGADLEYSPGSVHNNAIASTRTGPDSVWNSYTVGAPHYDYDVTYRQGSPYLHAEFSPVPRARVDVGLRHDNVGYDYVTRLEPVDTGRFRVPDDTRRHFQRLSPKVGLAVDLTDRLNAYASYRQGFRAPSQGQLFQQGANRSTVGLRPVVAHSTEAGLRGSLGDRVLYSVAVYDMRVRNDILSILDGAGVTTSSNAGETRHRGVEASMGAALLPLLRLDGAWSTATHTYEDWVIPVAGRNVSFAGHTMEQAPHTSGNLLLTWKPPLLNGGRVAVEWSHTGTYYMDAENTHTYGGFDLWTLHGNYRLHGGAEVFGRVANLADTRFAELVSYNAFNGEQYTPGNPRTVFAGLRWTWQR